MKIELNTHHFQDAAFAEDLISLGGVLDTDTGLFTEKVRLPFDTSVLEGMDLSGAAIYFQELQEKYAGQFNDCVRFVNIEDDHYEAPDYALVGTRTTLPGEPNHPETFTRALDGIYPDRTWRPVPAPDRTNTGAVLTLDSPFTELCLESYLQRMWHWVDENRELSTDTTRFVLSVDRERAKLTDDSSAAIRFALDEDTTQVIAQVTSAGRETRYWACDLPETLVDGARENLLWIRKATKDTTAYYAPRVVPGQ